MEGNKWYTVVAVDMRNEVETGVTTTRIQLAIITTSIVHALAATDSTKWHITRGKGPSMKLLRLCVLYLFFVITVAINEIPTFFWLYKRYLYFLSLPWQSIRFQHFFDFIKDILIYGCGRSKYYKSILMSNWGLFGPILTQNE